MVHWPVVVQDIAVEKDLVDSLRFEEARGHLIRLALQEAHLLEATALLQGVVRVAILAVEPVVRVQRDRAHLEGNLEEEVDIEAPDLGDIVVEVDQYSLEGMAEEETGLAELVANRLGAAQVVDTDWDILGRVLLDMPCLNLFGRAF
jgi:hypothetical protein